MSAELDWSPDFCLACDRQTDGSIYCGEACRLAEYEKSSAGSAASSPASAHSPFSWPSTQPSHNFYLPPAYKFESRSSQSASQRPQSSPVVLTRPVLTPSSSQSSLFSMQSNASTTSETNCLSDDARRELRAYASCFDQSRYQRRQSAF